MVGKCFCNDDLKKNNALTFVPILSVNSFQVGFPLSAFLKMKHFC